MFRLDLLLEQWTQIYEPMRHNPRRSAKPEEKAFFTIDRFDLQNEWQRTFNSLKKPALLYCDTIDAQLAKNNPKAVEYQHGMYLVCKQRSSRNYETDEEGARCAKLDLNDMCLDMLAFLFLLSDFANGRPLPKDTPQAIKTIADSLTAEDRLGIRGLRLGETQWWSAPRYKNGWWVLGIEMFGMDSRLLCVTPERYVKDK